MKKLGVAFVFSLVALVAWQLSHRSQREEFDHDPWHELVERLDERSERIEQKIERWKRYKAVRDEADRALLEDGLPLRTAAVAVLAAVEADYPEFLEIADTIAGQELRCGKLAKVASLIVHGYRLEFHMYGNRKQLDPTFVQRLESELAEIMGDAPGPDAWPSFAGKTLPAADWGKP